MHIFVYVIGGFVSNSVLSWMNAEFILTYYLKWDSCRILCCSIDVFVTVSIHLDAFELNCYKSNV